MFAFQVAQVNVLWHKKLEEFACGISVELWSRFPVILSVVCIHECWIW